MTTPPPFTVRLSPEAVTDLTDIRTYIAAQGAPLAAQRHAERLEHAIERLEHHPRIGRHAGGGVRELVVVRPQVIRYRIKGQTVEVLRIRHGRQKP